LIQKSKKSGQATTSGSYPIRQNAKPMHMQPIQGVWMKPGWTHNIINLSDTEDLVTVMWASEMLDKNRPDTFFEKV